jgi:DNA-binding HxlR family transcriptional regulator
LYYYSLFEYKIYICTRKIIRMKELDLQFPTCPIRNVLGRFADKWSLLILCNLQAQGKMRYTEIRKAVPDISQKMLTSTLKQLEKDHLLKRKAYAEIPPRVEYSLTELGLSLMPIIGQMIEWAQVHFEEVTK